MATKDPSNWLSDILARKAAFEKSWWPEAERAQRMYDKPRAETEKEQVPFNILYANTEILLPALYSATPRPDVSTRGKGHPLVAKAVNQLLTNLLDDNTPGAETFDSAMEGATLSALVPGCGGVRIRHYPESPRPLQWEEFKYNQLVWGYAKKWARVPWIAFIHYMSRDEIIAEFKLKGEKAEKFKLAASTGDEEGESTQCTVYELWIKAERRVLFLCEEYEGSVLDEVTSDPLKLAGFFPTPGLLTLVRKPSDVDPVPLYSYYQQQAEELNRVTVRLNKVLSAIRVRGAFNPLLGNVLADMLKPENAENGLVATDRAMDLQGGGFDKHIWLLPFEKLVTVAQQLYQARQAILQVIYQITGLADVVRGSTQASESATAQNIKNKWGNLRLSRMQRTVEVYARSLLRLATDAATTALSPAQWSLQTDIELPFAQQKQEATMQYQMVAQMAQQAGQQPPPPPPQLALPSWEEALQFLGQDDARTYIIDIETSSTVQSDAAMDKEEVAMFMGALGQLLQGLGPLAQLGPAGITVAKALVLSVVKRFKLGREVEHVIKNLDPGALQQAQAKQQKADDNPAKAKAEMQSIQLQGQVDAAKAQAELAAIKRKEQLDQRKFELDMRRMQLEEAKLAMQAMMPPQPPARPPARPRA